MCKFTNLSSFKWECSGVSLSYNAQISLFDYVCKVQCV